MFKCIIITNYMIIIDEGFSRIIWRINIDNVNLSFVSFLQQLQRSKVITFNQEVLFTAIINE